MVALVNSLLNVSRLELGTFAVEPESTDVIGIARSVIDELQVVIKEKKIVVETSFEKIAPYLADPKLLRIIFQNLLSNAVKYTPAKGEVRVTIELDDTRLLIIVQDNGMGIPKDQQGEIFTKLFRADNVREQDTEGTGLGLYLVKSIVEHAGGEISFESDEDKGTTMTVYLPASGMVAKDGDKQIES